MSTELIQLGLAKPFHHADARAPLAAIVDRLIALLAEIPVESEKLKASEFSARLQSFQTRIMAAPDGDAAVTALQLCLDACQKYLHEARAYFKDRENEIGQVVKVLREALAELAAESGEFHGTMLSTTERFQQLTNIEDLRVLRNAITQEVGGLKKLLADKQKKDQASFTRLSKRINGLQSKLKEAQEEAAQDALTRTANRGGFDTTLARWLTEYEQGATPFVLALLDIDDFKRVNDTLGHQIGDRVLICAAQWLKNNVRGEDLVARYGGEEFAVLLGGLNLKQAEAKFAALLEKVAASNYEYEHGAERHTLRFTFSCGLTEYAPGDTSESLVSRADEALYQSKRNGKNQVRCKARHGWRNLFR